MARDRVPACHPVVDSGAGAALPRRPRPASPRALEIHSTTHSYPSLSLDVYATRQAARQTLAYLLFFC